MIKQLDPNLKNTLRREHEGEGIPGLQLGLRLWYLLLEPRDVP